MKAIKGPKASASGVAYLPGFRSTISTPGLTEARWKIQHAPPREFSLAPRAANAKALAIAGKHFEKALHCGRLTSSAQMVFKETGNFAKDYHGTFNCLTSSCLLKPCKTARAKVDAKGIRKHLDVDLPDIYERCRPRRGKRNRSLALIVLAAPPDADLSLLEHANFVEACLEALCDHETWRDIVAGGFWRLQVEFPRNVHYNLLVEVKSKRRAERELRSIWNTMVKGFGEFSFHLQWVEDWNTYEELCEHIDRIVPYSSLPDDKARSLVAARKGQKMPTPQDVLAATVGRRRVGWFGEWFNSDRRQRERRDRERRRMEIKTKCSPEFRRRAARASERRKQQILAEMVAEAAIVERQRRRERALAASATPRPRPLDLPQLLSSLQDLEDRPVPERIKARYGREVESKYHRAKECPIDIVKGSLRVTVSTTTSTRAKVARSLALFITSVVGTLGGQAGLRALGLPRWFRRRVATTPTKMKGQARAARFMASTSQALAKWFGAHGAQQPRLIGA